MLIQFTIENFLSFKEENTLNMLATTDSKHKHHLLPNKKKKPLLRTVALYGANGSGKSNLIRAIAPVLSDRGVGIPMALTSRKKRPIGRQSKPAPHRDARLFIIATEGRKTEKQYFSMFGNKRCQVLVCHV